MLMQSPQPGRVVTVAHLSRRLGLPRQSAAHGRVLETPQESAGKRVVVVGGGSSAAQILAEIFRVAETIWITPREPRLLPDEVDGRALFAAATERVRAQQQGRDHPGVGSLGDVVAVASVRDARDRGMLNPRPMFTRLISIGIAWHDGAEEVVDAVIWCTGFRPPCAISPACTSVMTRVACESAARPTRSRPSNRGWSWVGTATGPALHRQHCSARVAAPEALRPPSRTAWRGTDRLHCRVAMPGPGGGTRRSLRDRCLHR